MATHKEQIKKIRAVQTVMAMAAIAQVPHRRRKELIGMAQELESVGNSKNEILVILKAREELTEEESKALEGVLILDYEKQA